MEQHGIYVGVDVAKARVDVAIRPGGDRREVCNDQAGIAALVAQMQQLNPAALVLEATGGLELPLVAALAAASLPVVVVNPRQVRDFARATGRLAKTDSLDAAVLAHFAEAVRPPRRPLRDAETQVLSSLVARRQQVMTMLVAERNRLSSATMAVRPSIEAHIAWLKQQLDDLGPGLAPDPPPESCMAGEGRPAAQRTRHRRPDLSYPSGIPARTGHSQPPTDRCPSGRGSLQPGQWYPAGQTHRLGWTGQGPHSPLYGGVGSQSLQPGHQGLLPAPVVCRQAEKAGSDRLHAQAADNPQLHAQVRLVLEPPGREVPHPFLLTFKTVA